MHIHEEISPVTLRSLPVSRKDSPICLSSFHFLPLSWLSQCEELHQGVVDELGINGAVSGISDATQRTVIMTDDPVLAHDEAIRRSLLDSILPVVSALHHVANFVTVLGCTRGFPIAARGHCRCCRR